jgi:hypothetical protein
LIPFFKSVRFSHFFLCSIFILYKRKPPPFLDLEESIFSFVWRKISWPLRSQQKPEGLRNSLFFLFFKQLSNFFFLFVSQTLHFLYVSGSEKKKLLETAMHTLKY